MRTIQSLTPVEIDHILADAPKRCYTEIAEEHDVGVNTIKRVIRTSRLKRYSKTSKTTTHILRAEGP